MKEFDQTILARIFFHVDSFKDLLRISMVCRQWRNIIIEKDFLQKRFLRRQRKYFIYHWKFNESSNLALNSNRRMKIDKFYQTGHLQQDTCFLGSCLIFDAHSSMTIPLDSSPSSEQFSISVWVRHQFEDEEKKTQIFF